MKKLEQRDETDCNPEELQQKNQKITNCNRKKNSKLLEASKYTEDSEKRKNSKLIKEMEHPDETNCNPEQVKA